MTAVEKWTGPALHESMDPLVESPASDLAKALVVLGYAQNEPDTLRKLKAIREVREHLARAVDGLAVEYMKGPPWHARWEYLADALGVTRQAVFKRYTAKVGPRRHRW